MSADSDLKDLLAMIADAVVIGGGIAGTSVLFHLVEKGLKGVLLEKEPFLGSGSSAASAGMIHHQFLESVNRLLSKASLRILNEFESRFDARIDFRRNGYLQTAGTLEDFAELKEIHQALLALGVDAQMLAPAELADMFPGIVVDDLLGALLTPGDGHFDPHGVIQTYAAAARRLGARILTDTPATGIIIKSGKVEGVKTSTETLSTEIVVDAAGPFAARVANFAALHAPIVTVKRQIFVSAPTTVIPPTAPFYFDKTPPFYFRPESGGLLLSIAELDECSPAELKLDWKSAEVLSARAIHRMPALGSLQLVRGWAGLRSMTPDRTAILGPVPEPQGLYLAAGFSGHGVMHSPMTGRIVAGVILNPSLRQFENIDIRPLLFERFLP
jgi:sarcosine oxidase subunit beta